MQRIQAVFAEVRRGETVLLLDGGGTLVVPRVLKGFKSGDPVDLYIERSLTDDVRRARAADWEKRRKRA